MMSRGDLYQEQVIESSLKCNEAGSNSEKEVHTFHRRNCTQCLLVVTVEDPEVENKMLFGNHSEQTRISGRSVLTFVLSFRFFQLQRF
jgi:hypothetical protein